VNLIDSDEIVRHVQKLPVLSSVVTELLTSMDQEDVDVDSIAQKIAFDQVLTVKTLRLANSSFYGMQHKISSVSEAISIIGFRNVRMMIASSAITGSFKSSKIKHFNFSSFWQHSIGTAVCAREIAAHIGSNQEYAFITGLIHDIGKLVLVTHYAEQYEKALEYQISHGCDSLSAEREILGTDHSEISKAVVKYWKFPEEMQLAVAKQHLLEVEHADGAASETGPVHQLAGVVHLADIFSIALDFAGDEYAVVPKISATVWEKMQLDEATCNRIFSNAEKKFEEISQILIE
jgi:putative nucleotidyltransferase with HDIG domain